MLVYSLACCVMSLANSSLGLCCVVGVCDGTMEEADMVALARFAASQQSVNDVVIIWMEGKRNLRDNQRAALSFVLHGLRRNIGAIATASRNADRIPLAAYSRSPFWSFDRA